MRFIITTWRIMEMAPPKIPKIRVLGPMAAPDMSAAKPIKNDIAIESYELQLIAAKTSNIKSRSGLAFNVPKDIISITLLTLSSVIKTNKIVNLIQRILLFTAPVLFVSQIRIHYDYRHRFYVRKIIVGFYRDVKKYRCFPVLTYLADFSDRDT